MAESLSDRRSTKRKREDPTPELHRAGPVRQRRSNAEPSGEEETRTAPWAQHPQDRSGAPRAQTPIEPKKKTRSQTHKNKRKRGDLVKALVEEGQAGEDIERRRRADAVEEPHEEPGGEDPDQRRGGLSRNLSVTPEDLRFL